MRSKERLDEEDALAELRVLVGKIILGKSTAVTAGAGYAVGAGGSKVKLEKIKNIALEAQKARKAQKAKKVPSENAPITSRYKDLVRRLLNRFGNDEEDEASMYYHDEDDTPMYDEKDVIALLRALVAKSIPISKVKYACKSACKPRKVSPASGIATGAALAGGAFSAGVVKGEDFKKNRVQKGRAHCRAVNTLIVGTYLKSLKKKALGRKSKKSSTCYYEPPFEGPFGHRSYIRKMDELMFDAEDDKFEEQKEELIYSMKDLEDVITLINYLKIGAALGAGAAVTINREAIKSLAANLSHKYKTPSIEQRTKERKRLIDQTRRMKEIKGGQFWDTN